MTAPAKVWEYRTLIGNLAARDLRSRYKKSLLGWLWSLINPAATLGIYTVVFGYFLKGSAPIGGNGTLESFALWLFAALVLWNSFSNGINTAMSSFLSSGGLLTRTYFPPECPVIAGSITVLTQTCVESMILLGFMVALGNLGWTTLFLPIIALLTTCFAFGIGMIVSLLNVRYRDVAYLVGIFLQIGFYATPIVYRLDQIPNHVVFFSPQVVLKYNPLTHFVGAMRNAVYLLQPPTLVNWLVMIGSAAASMLIGWRFFARRAPRFIEEI